jgi:heme-degrading monooxygenase HmoA
VIAVIFEVRPAGEEGMAEYLERAAALKEELSGVDGFLGVERFRSLADPGRLLSLSFWRDEAAVRDWRTRPAHREGQAAGRAGVFAAYRLRVAHVVRDYGLRDRAQAPAEDDRTDGG